MLFFFSSPSISHDRREEINRYNDYIHFGSVT